MKKLFHILSLAALATMGHAGASEPAPAADFPALKIVTLNLYHDKDEWPKRRVQIAATLEQLRPDVVALQEVLQHETLTNQAQWLAGQLGYQWYFVSTDPAGKPRRYGNAVLIRRPVLERGQKFLQPSDDSRTAAFVRIDLEGRPLNVYVTHLHWTDEGGRIRAQQVAALKEFIDATSEGIPSVVAGDFNASADAPELAALRTDFIDTYGSLHPDADAIASSTLNLKYFAPKRIDHVFFQRDAFDPVASEIIFNHADAEGTWASDHFGLSATLRLRPGHCNVRAGLDPQPYPDVRAVARSVARDQGKKFRMVHGDLGDRPDPWAKDERATGSTACVPAEVRLDTPANQEDDAGQGPDRSGVLGTGATELPALRTGTKSP